MVNVERDPRSGPAVWWVHMRKSVIVAFVATLLSAHGTSAQPAPWAPERLTAGWVFTPSAVLGVLHDSNVTLRAVNEPINAENVALVNPRGEIDFNGRRTHFNIGYSGALEAYQQFSELNRYEQHGRLELRQQALRHLQLFSTAGYSSVPTTDRLELGAGVLPFIGIGSSHADVSGGFPPTNPPPAPGGRSLNAPAVPFHSGSPPESPQIIP